VRFSIVIPTCQRNHLLALCLHRLAPGAQTIGEAYEVIVTDDGAANEAKPLIEASYPWARWVEGPKRGPAANRNCGARQARGQWLVFLDDDCLPDAQLLDKYLGASIDSPQIEVFEGRISADRPRQRMDEEAPINESGGQLWSCNFMIRQVFFHKLGGFNEAFHYAAMEDVDLRKRVQAVGKIVFMASAFVVHPWRRCGNAAKKWNRVLQAHKVYLSLNPHDRAFRPVAFSRLIAAAVLKGTLPDLWRFKALGAGYALHFHLFQLRLLAFLLARKCA
jgi:GT2 family glycosyltransferase